MSTGVNIPAARSMLSVLLPLAILWLAIGFVLSLLYHLYLWVVEREMARWDRAILELAVSALRFVFFILAWPMVLYFDESFAERIGLFVTWLMPRRRKTDPDLLEARRGAELINWEERRQAERDSRVKELDRVPLERVRRRVTVREDDPRLDRMWLLAAVGRDSAGSSRIVWLYERDSTLAEIADRARNEVALRRPGVCPKCEDKLAAARVRIPEPIYLRVVDSWGEQVVCGWALEGRYSVDWQACDDCARSIPTGGGCVSDMGRATDIVRAARRGVVFFQDTGEGPSDPRTRLPAQGERGAIEQP